MCVSHEVLQGLNHKEYPKKKFTYSLSLQDTGHINIHRTVNIAEFIPMEMESPIKVYPKSKSAVAAIFRF